MNRGCTLTNISRMVTSRKGFDVTGWWTAPGASPPCPTAPASTPATAINPGTATTTGLRVVRGEGTGDGVREMQGDVRGNHRGLFGGGRFDHATGQGGNGKGIL